MFRPRVIYGSVSSLIHNIDNVQLLLYMPVVRNKRDVKILVNIRF